jgi:hypothetical protein
MHRHLIRVVARPQPPRPAKVVSLAGRRKVRLEAAQAKRPPTRPAA